MMRPVDDLVGPAGGTATSVTVPDGRGVGHTTSQCPPTPVSPTSRARERVGPVRRMLLAAPAGGLVGVPIPSVGAPGRVPRWQGGPILDRRHGE